jgi:hypothetical protein
MVQKITEMVKRVARPRASVFFPERQRRLLAMLAKEKRISLAWAARETTEPYVRNQSLQSNEAVGDRL